MRLFPILSAILAVMVIYIAVFERDRLGAMMTGGDETVATADLAQGTPDTAIADNADVPMGVVVVRSAARPIDRSVILRGRTEADRQVELRAETSGQVVSDPLRKGALVEAGQTLCAIDPGTRESDLATARARLAEARARVPEAEAREPEAAARVEEAESRVIEAQSRLEEAQINYNAASRLSEDGFAAETRVAATRAAVRGAEAAVVSARAGLKAAQSGLKTVAAETEAARAGVESAQAAVATAEREIGNLTIAAPFAGLLETDTAELGSLLQPGSLCATVIQLDPIILVGFVAETEVSRVRLGADATARLASGEVVTGKVVFVSRAADPTTRTFQVEAEVANPDLVLRDGQTAEIEIEADGTTAHLLPQSALTLSDEGTLGVRAVDAENHVRFAPVTLLRDAPNGVWVAGLPETADVIVIGQEYVTEGVRVTPSYREIGQ